MTRKEALEKIKKCLSLSDSENLNESQSAMLMAQRLMLKYSISHNSLNEKEIEIKRVKNITIIFGKKRLMWYEKALGNIVGENFKVVSYSSGGRENGKSLHLMGLEEDVEIAQEVFSFALDSMKELGNRYIKTYNIPSSSRSNYRNDFYRGYISGLDSAFKRQVTEEGWGLVLVKDAIVIKEEENLGLRSVKSYGIPPKFAGSKKAYNEGYTEGEKLGAGYKGSSAIDTIS